MDIDNKTRFHYQLGSGCPLIDASISEAGLRDTYHVIVQSDHGGQEHHHTAPHEAVMTIPWIAAGPTIRAGHEIRKPVSIVDTVPTIARIVGIPHHLAWEGKPVNEIFLKSDCDCRQDV